MTTVAIRFRNETYGDLLLQHQMLSPLGLLELHEENNGLTGLHTHGILKTHKKMSIAQITKWIYNNYKPITNTHTKSNFKVEPIIAEREYAHYINKQNLRVFASGYYDEPKNKYKEYLILQSYHFIRG